MWSYSGNPKDTPKDLYRFKISDTDIDNPILQDEEIAYVVDTYTSDTERLYYLYTAMANKFAIEAVNKSLGPQSEDNTERKNYFEARAAEYKALLSSLGAPSSKLSKSNFRVGMHSNV